MDESHFVSTLTSEKKLPMMMCSVDVTGSFTPTVAKHTQSVEPAEKSKHRRIN